MALRTTLLAPLALLASILIPAGMLAAQEVSPEAKPQEPAPVAKPQEPTPAERAEELQQNIEKVERELRFTRSIQESGGLLPRIRVYLTDRQPTGDVVELSQPADPSSFQDPAKAAEEERQQQQTQGVVRLLGDGEKERLGEGVIFTVDGMPVRQEEFDAIYAYYKSFPRAESDEEIRRLSAQALIMQKAAAAHFGDSAEQAHQKIAQLKSKLDDGGEFAVLAKEFSDCPSKAQGGDLGMFGRGQMDPMFEMAAFSLKVGETSEIVQSAFGYHIIKVTGHEAGSDAAGDQVRASHILAMYDTDSNAVRQVIMKARSGQVEVACIDPEWRDLLSSGR